MARDQTPLEEMTLRQLRKVASQYKVSRYSRMRKAQLLAAIKQAIQEQSKQTLPDQSLIQEKIGEQQAVESSNFEVGSWESTPSLSSSIDDQLGDLPDSYGENRIVLLPRDPQWCYAYWDISPESKAELQRQGGQQLALRLYDVTNINFNYQTPNSIQEYFCEEFAFEWYLPIPFSERDYIVDIGYRCFDGRWLVLARSFPVRVPPVYPSDWVEDIFVTIDWDEELRNRVIFKLVPPHHSQGGRPVDHQIANMAERVDSSVFGSIQHIPGSVISSFVHQEEITSYLLPSGIGMLTLPTLSGVNMSGLNMSGLNMSGLNMSGVNMSGLNMSGLNMSGLNMSGLNMSGFGFSSSAIPERPRKFWLVADAELIVYGATEPDAIVTIGGHPIKLNADGTFRFQISFQDGTLDYPIMAVAADGEQTRSIHLQFSRETPESHINSKEEAILEWP
ncbi:MAG TPA: Rho termination protein [Cyanothece sp. UBA12306]|nr:Rho termination protein [Cyanothece sp. UBA12306]